MPSDRSKHLLGSASLWRNIVLTLVAFFSLTAAAGTAQARVTGNPAWWVVGYLLGLGLLVAMWWRRRWPVIFAIAASAVTIAFPIDGFLPLVGLYAVLLCAARSVCFQVGAAAYVAVAVSFWRDSAGHGSLHGSDASSLWRQSANPSGAHFPIWVVLLIAAVLVGATTALGLLGRSRHSLRQSRRETQKATERVDELGEQVSRQQERERIAQEVHDVLGHRLSLLSVHAGALEVAATNDPTLAERAKVVRENAQQSMGDLRSLLGVLRQPEGAEQHRPLQTLADLPELVDECIDAGSPVSSSVFVDGSEPLDPLVSHSAFRICQELLTNARKHAPGTPIRLQLNASPEHGIEITTANHAAGVAPGGAVHAGNGLTGVDERTRRCGGESWVWIDDAARFRCRVVLPWTMPRGEQAQR